MKIAIATALYPPDTAPTALYVKELAMRLKDRHEITVITYGHIPEEIEGVRIMVVQKRMMLPIRLARFTFALWNVLSDTDVLYVENGPSVELPVGLAMLFRSCPFVVHIGDKAAHTHASQKPLRRNLEKLGFRKAQTTIENMPPEKPEILPFTTTPQSMFDAYESAWNEHTKLLERTFKNATA